MTRKALFKPGLFNIRRTAQDSINFRAAALKYHEETGRAPEMTAAVRRAVELYLKNETVEK